MLIVVAGVAACTAPPHSDLPPFPRFDRESGIRLTAGLFGRLILVNGCLALGPARRDDAGPPTYLVFHDDAVIGRDARGIYLREGGSDAVIRVGELVSGGGGFLGPRAASRGESADVTARAWLNERITPDLPPGCGGPYASFHGFRAWDGRTDPF